MFPESSFEQEVTRHNNTTASRLDFISFIMRGHQIWGMMLSQIYKINVKKQHLIDLKMSFIDIIGVFHEFFLQKNHWEVLICKGFLYILYFLKKN